MPPQPRRRAPCGAAARRGRRGRRRAGAACAVRLACSGGRTSRRQDVRRPGRRRRRRRPRRSSSPSRPRATSRPISAVCTHQRLPGGQRRGRRHHLPVPRQPTSRSRRRVVNGRPAGPDRRSPPRRSPSRGRSSSPDRSARASRPRDVRSGRGRPRELPPRTRVGPGRARGLPLPRRRTAGSSTSARPRACARGSAPTSRTSPALHPRTQTMVTTAASVEWTVVATEVEALQLEYSWIKEFDPRFNVKYRDDKSYPCLAVTLDEEFPRLQVMRGAEAQGRPLLRAVLARLGDPRDPRPAAARLPGPDLQQRRLQAGRPGRPALPARLHRQVLRAVRRSGLRRGAPADRPRTSARSWTATPRRSSAASSARCARPPTSQDYERAARLRDDIGALRRAMEKNAVVLGDATDADVIALAEDELEAAVQVFHVRGGRIRGQRGFVVEKVEDVDTGDLVEQLLLQLYGGETGERGPARDPRPRPARRRARRDRVALRRCAAPRSTCASRSEATSAPCSRPSPATRGRPSPCTRPGGPAT